MNQTPFFPVWQNRLAPMGRRIAQTLETFQACTLGQLEDRFGLWVPPDLFPKTLEKANSRDRIYTRWRTFWSMLWQGGNPNASGREVVRQIQALSELQGGPNVSEEDGAYCRAKARLPLDQFPKALAVTAQAAYQAAPATGFLQGRHLKVVDGTAMNLPDTPKNRKTYPPTTHPNPAPNFPQMRVVVLFCLLGGAILNLVTGDLHTAELPLLHQLLNQLVQGDILMGDLGFGNFVLLGLLQNLHREVDFIGRSRRKADGRRRMKRLGKDDWLVQWQRGSSPSPWMSLKQWLDLPEEITLRMVRGNCHVKGFRVCQITLVTTLLDAQRYPAGEILQAYLRRWRLEMCLDDLKTTLGMEMLRSRSPEMAQREIYTRLIAHNLIRCTMAQAAREHAVHCGDGDKQWLRDFDGWDLRAWCHVDWRVPKEPSKVRIFTRHPIQKVWLPALMAEANKLLTLPVYPHDKEPKPTRRVEDEEIVEFLIGQGLRIAAAEELTTTFRRIRRLANYYYNYPADWADIREHETRTFLIVPLLLALGWPEQSIKIEQPMKGGRVDLALFNGPFTGNPAKCIALIETKGFAQGLSYAPEQARNYAKHFPKCRVVFVSNGYCYKAYRRTKNGFSTEPSAYLNIRDPRDAYPQNPKIPGALEVLRLLLKTT